MQRNIARAYDALWAERERVRAICIKILAQGDPSLERRLLRAKPENPKHLDEVLLYEDRLSRPERRRILGLNRYGRKIEKLLDALLKV
jgi:hypothetical protein